MRLEALLSLAPLKTSLGGTREALRVPTTTVSTVLSVFLLSKWRDMKYSLSSVLISGSASWTSTGPAIRGPVSDF